MTTTPLPDVRLRNVDGVRVSYADSGGTAEPTIVLSSPWPESLYAFAPLWATLSPHARLFAVDLPPTTRFCRTVTLQLMKRGSVQSLG
jgi:hypothetical protein